MIMAYVAFVMEHAWLHLDDITQLQVAYAGV